MKALNYDRINVALINAIKELGAEKDAQMAILKAENVALQQHNSVQMSALQQQNVALSERLTALEKKLLDGASHKLTSIRGRRASSHRVMSN